MKARTNVPAEGGGAAEVYKHRWWGRASVQDDSVTCTDPYVGEHFVKVKCFQADE